MKKINNKRNKQDFTTKLPTEILLLIRDFLDNKTNINLFSTSKLFNNYGKMYGYLKDIVYNNKNISKFIQNCHIHNNTLNRIIIKNTYNCSFIFLNIPFVKEMYIENCLIEDIIDNITAEKTEKLFIKSNYKVSINIKKFTNLKYKQIIAPLEICC